MSIDLTAVALAASVIRDVARESGDAAALAKKAKSTVGPTMRALILADKGAARKAAEAGTSDPMPHLSGFLVAVMDGMEKDHKRKARQYLNSMLVSIHKSQLKSAADLGEPAPPALAVYGETDGPLTVQVKHAKKVVSSDVRDAAIKALQAARDACLAVLADCTPADRMTVETELDDIAGSLLADFRDATESDPEILAIAA